MSYTGAVNTIRAVAEAVNPDGFFLHGRKWEASLSFNENDQQIYLYPLSANISIANHYYESWRAVIGFYFQDAPDSTAEQMEELIKNADILARLFIATLDTVEGIDIDAIQLEPSYRNNAGTYTGVVVSLTLGATSDLCSITVDDIIIPPAQTLCEAVRLCVGSVDSVEVSGNGTTTITITETIGKDILLVATDGRIRKTTDYSHNATTGAFTFISAIQSTQKIYVLFK